MKPTSLQVVDSHTGGEPTRLVIDGSPDLGTGSMAERRQILERDHDWVRSAVVNEPRGSDAIVGGLLLEPSREDCDLGVIFFNNKGYINMCVHGTIGLGVTLHHLGKLAPGESARIETPVGVVTAQLIDSTTVRVANVPSYRRQAGLRLTIDGYGDVTADIAWGGNWFLLVEEHSLEVSYANLPELTEFCIAARRALERDGITGDDGMVIDHIEVFAPAPDIHADSRNYVLCPGGAYDRSPCGTGTSAKLACLFESGKLREGEIWRQAGIVGSVFEGTVRRDEAGELIPEITGTAYITAESKLIIQADDPFAHGIHENSVNGNYFS